MEREMYEELVREILDVLREQAVRIVLYGSVARGEATPESDIDIAVFIRSRMDANTEDRLSDAIVDLNLKYDRVFSVVDIDDALFSKWKDVTPFYRNFEREGIELWRAA